MFLICYGTRPEIIKLFPLINSFKQYNISFKTLFTGQHTDLISDFYSLIPKPDYVLDNLVETDQSLNKLTYKILFKTENILNKNKEIKNIIIQGDTTSAFSIPLLLMPSRTMLAVSSSPTTEIKEHRAPKALICDATTAAPPTKFLQSNSFTTTTGASALIPNGSHAAY